MYFSGWRNLLTCYFARDMSEINCGMISVISKHYYNYYDKNSIQLSDNGYVIIADEKLEYDFISNALLHYQYLDKDTPIAKDVKKFVFNTIYKVKNALLPVKLFQNVMENYDEFEKIIVYSIWNSKPKNNLNSKYLGYISVFGTIKTERSGT